MNRWKPDPNEERWLRRTQPFRMFLLTSLLVGSFGVTIANLSQRVTVPQSIIVGADWIAFVAPLYLLFHRLEAHLRDSREYVVKCYRQKRYLGWRIHIGMALPSQLCLTIALVIATVRADLLLLWFALAILIGFLSLVTFFVTVYTWKHPVHEPQIPPLKENDVTRLMIQHKRRGFVTAAVFLVWCYAWRHLFV